MLWVGWNELFIVFFFYCFIVVKDGIFLVIGLYVYWNSVYSVGVGVIFDRVLMEFVFKMWDM